MSCVEIYKIDTNGNSHLFGTAQNSWLGAMQLWKHMEEEYLPQYIPDTLVEIVENILDGRRRGFDWVKQKYPTIDDFKQRAEKDDIKILYHFMPSRCSSFDTKAMQDIWNLVDNENVPIYKRICLWTTFDYSVVKKEHIQTIINAMKQFEEIDSFKEQIVVLSELLQEDDCFAVAWNQTSVNCSHWCPCIEDCDEEDVPFDFFEYKKKNENVEYFEEKFS